MSTDAPQRGRDSISGQLAFSVAMFAGIMLAVTGIVQVFVGIAAVAEDTVFVRGLDYTYELDVTTWGWVHIVVGVVAVAVGGGIAAGQLWGRLGGIAIASMAVISNFLFMPYYPLWAIVLVAFNVLVIWALCRVPDDR